MNHTKLIILACLLFAGCGKDMKLGIKAAESEKDQSSAQLVRNVQVTYHTPAGKEEMRENIPVLGLSQPVSTRADLLKDLHVEKDGVFEARGYTADGTLVLRGQALASPEDSDAVQITMDRDASQATVFGSALLRRVRLANAAIPQEFAREAKDFQLETVKGRCVALPDLKINPGSGSQPKLIFEGVIKAPSFRVEVGVQVERGLFKVLSAIAPVLVNAAGDGELELGRNFLDGALFKGPKNFIIKLHSNQYEGCMELKTRPVLDPVSAVYSAGRGAGLGSEGPRGLLNNRYEPFLPFGVVNLINPNGYPATVQVTGIMTNLETGEHLNPCIHQHGDAFLFDQLRCTEIISETVRLGPNDRGGFAVFVGLNKEGFRFNRHLRIDWVINSKPDFSAVDIADVQLAPTIIH